VICARVSPRYRPFVALWVLSHSGRLSEVHALNLGGNTELDDLTPLAGLGALQALDLSGCNALTDIAPLAELRGLRSLDLSGCNALKDLAPLAGLTGLQSLNLRRVSRWFPPLDLSPIQKMRNLQSLDLSDWEHLDDLSFLQGLPALRSLNLGGCKRIVNLTPLGSLTNLTELDLSYCDEIAYHFRDAPPPFIQFKNLQRLSLLEVRSLKDYIDGDSEWLPRWSTVLEELTALSDFVPPDFYDEEEEEDDED
jgi:internalin A